MYLKSSTLSPQYGLDLRKVMKWNMMIKESVQVVAPYWKRANLNALHAVKILLIMMMKYTNFRGVINRDF
ncbi:hypothetical protein CMO83_04170 [Candidatus Woesearchaeota archaeon]|nr:hypothetical protein [Candidatus Woesearchaeota archaeon]